MLGKLYVTSHSSSSSEKLPIVADLLQEAIDHKVAADAPSRTALNKLHMAVKKAMGDAGTEVKQQQEQQQQQQQEEGETSLVLPTTIPVEKVEDDGVGEVTEVGDGNGSPETETVMEGAVGGGDDDVDEGTTLGQDSLLEELLDDDGDIEMTL